MCKWFTLTWLIDSLPNSSSHTTTTPQGRVNKKLLRFIVGKNSESQPFWARVSINIYPGLVVIMYFYLFFTWNNHKCSIQILDFSCGQKVIWPKLPARKKMYLIWLYIHPCRRDKQPQRGPQCDASPACPGSSLFHMLSPDLEPVLTTLRLLLQSWRSLRPATDHPFLRPTWDSDTECLLSSLYARQGCIFSVLFVT